MCRRTIVGASEETPTLTIIHSLGEDFLIEIFLILPSLVMLVRAPSLDGCRRVVASSQFFRTHADGGVEQRPVDTVKRQP
jgi:hypothetical protein